MLKRPGKQWQSEELHFDCRTGYLECLVIGSMCPYFLRCYVMSDFGTTEVVSGKREHSGRGTLYSPTAHWSYGPIVLQG